MKLSEIRNTVTKWQGRLGLSHWSIEVRFQEPENGRETVFEIHRHENAHRATIFATPWVEQGEPPEDLQETVDDVFLEKSIVHELCHLLFRDVVFVIRDDLQELLGQVTHELVMRNLGRHEEATVDLLSRALVENCP